MYPNTIILSIIMIMRPSTIMKKIVIYNYNYIVVTKHDYKQTNNIYSMYTYTHMYIIWLFNI